MGEHALLYKIINVTMLQETIRKCIYIYRERERAQYEK